MQFARSRSWLAATGYWTVSAILAGLGATCLIPASAAGQEADSVAAVESNEARLLNGGFEEVSGELPKDWRFSSAPADAGFELSLTEDSVRAGNRAAQIDARQTAPNATFANLSQLIDPRALRGKRVRFKAAVKTSDRDQTGRAQLWLRVDRESGGMGAFDNMGARPITVDDWQDFEIVVDVNDDAKSMIVGMLVFGKCQVWIDDASLEVVPETTKTTEMKIGSTASATAPRQPFFNHWLWLAGFGLTLFIVSQLGDSPVQRFALRFTVVYWLLYCFPSPFSSVFNGMASALERIGIPTQAANKVVADFSLWYQEQFEAASTWTAQTFLGVEGDLVSAIRNGSGDTTMAFVNLLVYFVIAMTVAVIWTAARWRSQRDSWVLSDLLRTYLRYVLALTMLSYGLHKAGFIMNQFARGGMPSDYQLNRTYGDSSPMGLLWTFMAASPAYTFFAGLGEVMGGVLLLFRRTMTLGALVTFGVMLNVMMLNFCYDVPVKQYSTHLTLMAILIAAPDLPRLFRVLVTNQETNPTERLQPAFVPQQAGWTWSHRVLKSLVILAVCVLPIFEHVYREVTFSHPEPVDTGHLLMDRGFRWINEFPFNR